MHIKVPPRYFFLRQTINFLSDITSSLTCPDKIQFDYHFFNNKGTTGHWPLIDVTYTDLSSTSCSNFSNELACTSLEPCKTPLKDLEHVKIR